jgi:alpha-ketoglutarate-dependent taurine dioxygenase
LNTNETLISGVVEEQIAPERPLPLIIRPTQKDVALLEIASEHRELIRERVLRHGGVLFRDFPDVTIEVFRQLIATLSGEPLHYQERTSPRHEVGSRIYTSTDYPHEQTIFLHNESSYSVTWPMHIFFYCVVAPEEGGATPLADCRKVYSRISEDTRKKLEPGYCYTRHYGDMIGLPWQEVFQTNEKSVIEEYCRENEIECIWGPNDTLSTRQIRPVVRRHPDTGEAIWFNHLTFFNIAILDEDIVEALLSLAKDQLPNNTYYADGRDIEPAVFEELRSAYLSERVRFPWHAGDILMLDNMLVAHGREPFRPPRKVVVGMASPARGVLADATGFALLRK